MVLILSSSWAELSWTTDAWPSFTFDVQNKHATGQVLLAKGCARTQLKFVISGSELSYLLWIYVLRSQALSHRKLDDMTCQLLSRLSGYCSCLFIPWASQVLLNPIVCGAWLSNQRKSLPLFVISWFHGFFSWLSHVWDLRFCLASSPSDNVTDCRGLEICVVSRKTHHSFELCSIVLQPNWTFTELTINKCCWALRVEIWVERGNIRSGCETNDWTNDVTISS